jgi:hypothetical protein
MFATRASRLVRRQLMILAVGRLLRLAQASSPGPIDDGIHQLIQISQEVSCRMIVRWRRQHGTIRQAFQAAGRLERPPPEGNLVPPCGRINDCIRAIANTNVTPRV